ncbi:MAG: DUF4359 domain-containing protein [Rhizonema sp. NSF051]|nr:DUF4359 domain-containing protein [Rhizonema sp. NSF051]
MKASTIVAYVGVAVLAALGIVMAKTNPTQAEYEEYAVQKLTKYLKTDVCKKTPSILESLISFNCNKFVDSAQPQMRGIITASTQRQDLIIVSIYITNLKLNSLLPSYKIETVGALDKFYTYNSEQE